MNILKTTLLLVSTCLIYACDSVSTLKVGIIKSSTTCAYSDSTFRQLSSQAEIARAIQSGSQVLLNEEQKAKGKDASVDLDKYFVLLLAAGQRPTAGYNFQLESEKAQLDKEAATVSLPLSLQEPPADSMQAQMLTSPCVLVQLQKGDVSFAKYGEQKITLK